VARITNIIMPVSKSIGSIRPLVKNALEIRCLPVFLSSFRFFAANLFFAAGWFYIRGKKRKWQMAK
jgi:hypothetical protein